VLCAAGCGRYEDFRLPAVERQPVNGSYVWEPRAAPVLTRGAAGQWDAVDTLNPSVVAHQNGYFNFYSGFDGKTWHTGLAVSPDGLNWTRRAKVLSPESAWEGDYIAANGAALRGDSGFLYWYQAGRLPRIGLARSADGVTWTREPAPVLEPGPRGSWDERGVADPYVIRQGGVYYMFYLGQDRARRQRLGVARSADGAVWTKLRANPILELGEYGAFDENGLGEPAVWYANGRYWMLYTGRDRAENRRMGLASSPDGAAWKRVPDPIISGAEPWNAKVVCDAAVEPTPEGVRVWFGGGDVASPDERLNGQIGYGMLRWRPAN
jgi:predicted GH43/DUF377 family glycosyl hydrolase